MATGEKDRIGKEGMGRDSADAPFVYLRHPVK